MENGQISTFLQERIDANDFPSAVYLVAEKGEIVFQDALGFAVVEPDRIEARIDTIYDLASLTKPLVTGLLTAKLVAAEELELSNLVYAYLPEFRNEDKKGLTVERLLLHTSGMAAWKPFYLETAGRAEISDYIASLPREKDEDFEVVYSDLNFAVLMFIVEKLYGEWIDKAAEHNIFDVLEIENTCFNPEKELRLRVAASEKGNEYEKNTCIELGYDLKIRDPQSAIRDCLIWGEVHDGNAWFMDGIAGHAGLFSTAEEVFKIALQFLPNYTQILNPETCDLFSTNFTSHLNEARSIAFQLAETPESTAGSRMSPQSFGHLGFTGTSLWIDPVTDRIFILLTNRTHAHSLPFVNINSVRRRFHDLANEALDKKT